MSSDISKCADSFCPSKDHCHRFTAPASKVWQRWGDFQRKGEPCCDAYWPAVDAPTHLTEKTGGSDG